MDGWRESSLKAHCLRFITQTHFINRIRSNFDKSYFVLLALFTFLCRREHHVMLSLGHVSNLCSTGKNEPYVQMSRLFLHDCRSIGMCLMSVLLVFQVDAGGASSGSAEAKVRTAATFSICTILLRTCTVASCLHVYRLRFLEHSAGLWWQWEGWWRGVRRSNG